MLTLKHQYDIINNKCMCANTDYNMQILTVNLKVLDHIKDTHTVRKRPIVGEGQ